jgi:hypothetical protein
MRNESTLLCQLDKKTYSIQNIPKIYNTEVRIKPIDVQNLKNTVYSSKTGRI